MPLTESDLYLLRRAIALAREGRERGADPFGAVLAQGNQLLDESFDRCVQESDPTYHVELSVISRYCRAQHTFSLEGATLYCSTEPCPMCAGAVHWSRVSRVVFSVSQRMLNKMSGGRPKLSCRAILNTRRVEIIGPVLPDEGLAVFEGYTFIPKADRHCALFGGHEPQ